MIDECASLVDICFAVGTAFEAAGIVAVLSGGSAATIYAASAYQSLDADFVLTFRDSANDAARTLASIGFRNASGLFVHDRTKFTIDLPPGPLSVGRDLISSHETITRADEILRIIRPEDSVKDRLCGYLYWNDRTALNAAVCVFLANRDRVELRELSRWVREEERAAPAYQQRASFKHFLARVGPAPRQNA